MVGGGDLVLRAAALAVRAHAGQRRKYAPEPYVNHPARVAALVTVRHPDPVLIAAAWLHDVVEDTPVGLDEISRDFGPEVAAVVAGCTNADHDESLPRAEKKRRDRARLASQPVGVKRIKLCDRLDNVRDLGAAPADFTRLYVGESRILVREALAGADPELEATLLAWCDWLAPGA